MVCRHRIGAKELYRGFTVVLLRNGSSNVLFFSLRNHFLLIVINTTYPATSVTARHRRFIADFISGAVLGASISSLLSIKWVKQRMQSTINSPFLSAWATFQII
uniref:Uncharacterized protein n=1 Tax=Wuchereria bancrofti TaxID=6293 RepID=A0A1I8EYX4_WUCBA